MRTSTPRCLAAAAVIASLTLTAGCGQDEPAEATGAQQTQQRTQQPTEQSAVLDDPGAYDGEQVSVEATVDEVIAPNAFTVPGNSSAAADLLVVHGGRESVTEGARVKVKGVVHKAFDLNTVAGTVNDSVRDALQNDWDKKPYLDATNGSVSLQE